MLRHIFKILWTERRVNLWIMIELTLIFCILWFCSDYLTFMFRRSIQPIGFDIENTYLIEILPNPDKLSTLVKETGKTEDDIRGEYGWLIYDRIKQNPDVKNISISVNTYPYNSGMNKTEVTVNNDTVTSMEGVLDRSVSPEYFDVFKMKFEKGKAFTWNDIGRDIVIINGNEKNEINGVAINDIRILKFPHFFNPETANEVTGIINKTKRDPFHPYENEVYRLYDKKNIIYLGLGSTICIRIKDNVDKNNFIEKFYNDMSDQINIGPFFLSKIIPFESVKEQYMFWQDYSGKFKSIGAIGTFLLVNIFLGLIGTFWFRTRERRNEIGLRMAIGSSKDSIKNIFIGETLLLVFIASIIGAIISVNIGLADVLKDIGVPIPDRNEKLDWLQYVLNFSITFCTLAIVSSLAVWYPARQASKTQPAIALRDE